MIVTESQDGAFHVLLDSEELLHLQYVVAAYDDLFVADVPQLIKYILTHIEQNWFLTVKEINPNGNRNTD